MGSGRGQCSAHWKFVWKPKGNELDNWQRGEYIETDSLEVSVSTTTTTTTNNNNNGMNNFRIGSGGRLCTSNAEDLLA